MITLITIRKDLLMLLLFILCSIHVIAQTDYYYYQGQKVPLTLNENRIVTSIPKDCNMISEKIHTNVQVLITMNDEAFDIFVISKSDFEKLTTLDFWEEGSKSVLISSSYFTEENKEVFSTPYLYVRLKEEQDIDLLDSYVKEYNLKIVESSSPLMPLWYVLSLTPETKKSSLECANELWETGYFAVSEPDFSAYDLLDDTTPVQSSSFSTPDTSSEIYDLQGRRILNKPAHGIYIKNGKKVLMK